MKLIKRLNRAPNVILVNDCGPDFEHPIKGSFLISPWVNVFPEDDFGITDEEYFAMGGMDYLMPSLAHVFAVSFLLGDKHERYPEYIQNPELAKILYDHISTQHPLISPIYGDYSEWTFGPMLLQCGGSEILNPFHHHFIDILRDPYLMNPPKLIVDMEPDTLHAYSMMDQMFGEESLKAQERIMIFISETCPDVGHR
jgi:hypothetical protein